jgi:hypothetical protein
MDHLNKIYFDLQGCKSNDYFQNRMEEYLLRLFCEENQVKIRFGLKPQKGKK